MLSKIGLGLLWLTLLFSIPTNSLFSANYKPISLPQFHKQALLNGLEFLVFPSNNVRNSFVLMIRNGAAFDPSRKWGLTYLTTQMMLEKTEHRTGQHIRESLKQMNAELEFQVGWDAITFWGSAPPDQIIEVLNLLAEIVVAPQFTDETFKKLRDRLVQQVEQEFQQLTLRTKHLFMAEIFRGNPYEHSVKGTSTTLANLQLTDIKKHYRKLFLPNQTQLAIEYSGNTDYLQKKTGGAWGIWRRKKSAPFTFRSPKVLDQPKILLVDTPDSESLFRWGKISVERDASEYYTLKVLEQYLMLLLPDWAEQITTQSKIQASSKLVTRKMPGYLELSIKATPSQLIAYFQKFQELVNELHKGHLDTKKFEEAKQLAYYEIIQSLEQPKFYLTQLLELTLYEVGLNFISHYGLRLERISIEKFKKTATKYLSMEDYVIIVAGPKDTFEPVFKNLGKVTILK